MSDEFAKQAVADTVIWLERAVIGLGLCPFAKAVHVKKQIHYAFTAATSAADLEAALMAELRHLAAANPDAMDTTLLIHPHVLTDFADYNDFLDVADRLLVTLDLNGVIQIASFHPHYQFACTVPDDIGNYTNRSPYPMLHLLRESSVERAVAAFPEAEMIYEKNIATLEKLGQAGWNALFEKNVKR